MNIRITVNLDSRDQQPCDLAELLSKALRCVVAAPLAIDPAVE